MSNIFNEETVQKVADLARLEVTKEELALFASQLGTVIQYVDSLNEVDTSQVEPLTNPLMSPTSADPVLKTRFHSDESRPGPGAEVMAGCAVEHLYDNFKVPQVIGNSSSGGGR